MEMKPSGPQRDGERLRQRLRPHIHRRVQSALAAERDRKNDYAYTVFRLKGDSTPMPIRSSVWLQLTCRMTIDDEPDPLWEPSVCPSLSGEQVLKEVATMVEQELGQRKPQPKVSVERLEEDQGVVIQWLWSDDDEEDSSNSDSEANDEE